LFPVQVDKHLLAHPKTKHILFSIKKPMQNVFALA